MYTRCFRRAAAHSRASARRADLLWHRRCLATAESIKRTTPQQNLLPALFSDHPQEGETWSARVGSLVDDAQQAQSRPENSLYEKSEELHAIDEHAHDNTIRAARTEDEEGAKYSVRFFPEDEVPSMPGVLSLVKEIEQRFGRIRYFAILRDRDTSSDYLRGISVIFDDTKSVEKVKEELRRTGTESIMLTMPARWDRNCELNGGIGLEDIQPFLLSLSRNAAADSLPGRVTSNEKIGGTLDGDIRSVREGEDSIKETTLPMSEPPTSELSSSLAPASFPLDAQEVGVGISRKDYDVIPNLHRHRWIIRSIRERKDLARSFLHWGGFYPDYRFNEDAEDMTRDGDSGIHGQEKKVRAATRAMRELLISHRRLLYDNGEPDHGLTVEDGRVVHVDWSISPGKQYSGGDKALPAQGPSTSPDTTIPPKAKQQTSRPTTTKAEKPKILTREEEERLERMFGPSSRATSGEGAEEATNPVSRSGDSSSSVVSSSSSPFESRHETSATDTSLRSRLNEEVTEAAASTEMSEEEMKEEENNRARRARKKEAQQKRAGLVAKFLGVFRS